MQEADQTLRAACEQWHACNLRTAYTDEHFSQQKSVFLQLPTSSHLASLRLLAARLIPPGASRQTPHAAVLLFLQSKSQPSGLQQPHFRQPLSTFIHSVLQPSNIPHPLSPLTFHQKKLSRRLSFSRCI